MVSPTESDTPPAPDEPNPLTRTLVVVGVLLATVGVAVIVGMVAYSPGPVGDIPVSLREYKIVMPTDFKAGRHTLGLANDGKVPHELVLFRTDLAADSLPTDKNGEVIEDSPQLEAVADSGSSLEPGTTRGVAVKLDPGHYVAVCNLPSHYEQGMQLDITVN